jgi:exodeoxyribonuclease VII large subunit
MLADDTQNRLVQSYRTRIASYGEHLQELQNRLQTHDPERRFDLAHQNLDAMGHRLKFATAKRLQYFSSELVALNRRLGNTNLQTALKRGFSILQETDGTVLTSAKTAGKASRIKARFHDGEVIWQVKNDTRE